MKMKYRCDWNHAAKEVRVVPTDGGRLALAGRPNALLCHRHFNAEMKMRHKRNLEADEPTLYTIEKWENLKVYDGDLVGLLLNSWSSDQLIEAWRKLETLEADMDKRKPDMRDLRGWNERTVKKLYDSVILPMDQTDEFIHENCMGIVNSVNVLWRLFSQILKISDLEASKTVEIFLEEKTKIHKCLSNIAQHGYSNTQTDTQTPSPDTGE